jgi:hypothetical protein
MQTTKKNIYGSLSFSNVNVPEEFNYMVKIHTNDTLLKDMQSFWSWDSIYSSDEGWVANPSTGLKYLDNLIIWVYNQNKSGFIYLYFKSKEEFDKLNSIITDKKKAQTGSIINPLYRYCTRVGWKLVDQYGSKDAEKDIFGYDNYIVKVEKDIKNHIKYNTFLKSLGEVRSINYLLYGPPGTGKTSMIKAIASKLACAVFIVNAGNVTLSNIMSILTPHVNVETECKVKLLLFEDFDRFLEVDRVDSIMSQILNSLDGFDDKGDTIRFFTANDKEKIFKVDALVNRMSSKFQFYFPTIEIFRGKLQRLLTFYEKYDIDKAEKLLELVMKKKITVRPFVNYVVRYLFDEHCLDAMIRNIDELN